MSVGTTPRCDRPLRVGAIRCRPAPRTVAAVLAVLSMSVSVGVGSLPSAAGAVTAGGEVITKVGTLSPLTSGSSTTPYGVVLPEGASCPGDTAHDGYLVYSYLVPKGALPTDVSFKTGLPSRGLGYFSNGAYFGAVNTAETTGQIVGIPTSFTWTRLTPRELFPGGVHAATWEGGIACATNHGVVTDYWNSEILFTADPSDAGGFTWKVVGQGPIPTPVDLGLWLGIALLVVASAAASYALLLRRRARADAISGNGPADPATTEANDRRPEPEPAGRSGR